jgi:hypothetical protein
MEEALDEIGHVGQPAARQIYLAPIGERAAWVIYELTLDADGRIPTFTKLSSRAGTRASRSWSRTPCRSSRRRETTASR